MACRLDHLHMPIDPMIDVILGRADIDEDLAKKIEKMDSRGAFVVAYLLPVTNQATMHLTCEAIEMFYQHVEKIEGVKTWERS